MMLLFLWCVRREEPGVRRRASSFEDFALSEDPLPLTILIPKEGRIYFVSRTEKINILLSSVMMMKMMMVLGHTQQYMRLASVCVLKDFSWQDSRTIWDAWDQIRVGGMQGKCPAYYTLAAGIFNIRNLPLGKFGIISNVINSCSENVNGLELCTCNTELTYLFTG